MAPFALYFLVICLYCIKYLFTYNKNSIFVPSLEIGYWFTIMNCKVTDRFIACYKELKKQDLVRSARQFALSLDFHAQSWNEILKGRRDVTLSLVERAVERYAFSPDFLYTGEGPLIKSSGQSGALRVLQVVTDRAGRENIVHVPTKAQAGYAAQAEPLEAIHTFTNYTLPGFEHRFATFRSFEVEGESMLPTIEPGEIVVCRYIAPDFWQKQLQDDQVYVIVSKEDLVIKRIKNRIAEHDALHLHSDNRDFEPYMIPESDVQEVWHVEKVIKNFDQAPRKQDRVGSPAELLEIVRIQSGIIEDLRSRVEN